jgi:hypothetical protein
MNAFEIISPTCCTTCGMAVHQTGQSEVELHMHVNLAQFEGLTCKRAPAANAAGRVATTHKDAKLV